MITKKIYTILCAIVLVGFATPANAQSQEYQEGDWQVTLGGGALALPEYEGSDEYEFLPVPYVDVRYKDLITLDPFDGLRYHLLIKNGFDAGFGLGYDWGRDEDDDSHINGMGDIDPTIEGQIFAGYSWGMASTELTFAQDLADGHEGYTFEAEAGHAFILSQRGAMVRPSISTTYASEKYMESYFGVSTGQSVNSGLSTYDAEAGFKNVALGAFATYPLTEKWSVNGIARYSRLIGDAADSPVSESDNQFMGGAFVAYKF